MHFFTASAPNNSFKPSPLRGLGAKPVLLGRAVLIQALAIMGRSRQMWERAKRIKPQHAIATFCLLIVLGRFIYPSLKYDTDSRDLILIAVVCILVPDLVRLITRIKKLKIGDNEVELGEALDDLANKTQAAEDQVDADPTDKFTRSGPSVTPNVERYLRDPRGGLIAVAVDIEERVNDLLKQRNYASGKRAYASPIHGIELLANQGVVVPELPSLMRDFWQVRNRAFHRSDIRLTEGDVLRLVDLGVRILDLLAITSEG